MLAVWFSDVSMAWLNLVCSSMNSSVLCAMLCCEMMLRDTIFANSKNGFLRSSVEFIVSSSLLGSMLEFSE